MITTAGRPAVATGDLRETLEGLYRRLLAYHGPQHWWPGDTPFEVIVGAILTQNTSWRNVERAIRNLSQRDVLSPEGIFRLEVEELAALVRPSGYYHSKAKKLKVFVDFLFETHGGDLASLLDLEAEMLRSELLGLWGVGEETADSIVLYAAGKPSFVVDAYTLRVFSRLGLCRPDTRYSALRQMFMSGLEPDPGLYNEYHALLVRHGKDTCRKRQPLCRLCPIRETIITCRTASPSPP